MTSSISGFLSYLVPILIFGPVIFPVYHPEVRAGVPTYLLTRQAIGNTWALFAMLTIMLPAFLLAMYEKDGLPFEKVIRNIIRVKFTRPGIRPYRTENIYAPFVRKEEPIEQSKKAEKRK